MFKIDLINESKSSKLFNLLIFSQIKVQNFIMSLLILHVFIGKKDGTKRFAKPPTFIIENDEAKAKSLVTVT